MQSAAILIEKEKGGYGGYNDRMLDLRVDEHTSPIKELTRIYRLYQLYFNRTKEGNIVPIDSERKQKIAEVLVKQGYLTNSSVDDQSFYEGLTNYIHTENFEERE